MILLTGGAGFVGSNLLKRLNADGETDVLVVDSLKNADKYRNLVGARFTDFVDRLEFRRLLAEGKGPDGLRAILHQGACTDTLEYDGAYMMRTNYDDSKALLHLALDRRIPFVYASSGAVYGHASLARETPEDEWPLNVYGYSKLQFDRYVRGAAAHAESTVVGLRYFNVYGNGEAHKGRMASMVFHFADQVRETGVARLFGEYGGYAPGESTRDFVSVRDLVELNLFFLRGAPARTVVNAGTGVLSTWNELARAVIDALGRGEIEYIPFPEGMRGKYQLGSRADLTRLRALGYDRDFVSLREGVRAYLTTMDAETAPFRPREG